jgi:hypothetical protein
MKKLWVLIMLIMVSPMFSCDDASQNESNPMSLIYMFGNNTLTVNVTYNGAYDTDPSSGGLYAGTKYVYVYLYNVRPVYTRSPVCVYSGVSSVPVTNATPQAITISGIWSGDYYLMVFYDYRLGDNFDNKSDRYRLYNGTTNGTNCIGQATTVSIPSASSVDITFDSTYSFPGGAGGGAGATFNTTGCP